MPGAASSGPRPFSDGPAQPVGEVGALGGGVLEDAVAKGEGLELLPLVGHAVGRAGDVPVQVAVAGLGAEGEQVGALAAEDVFGGERDHDRRAVGLASQPFLAAAGPTSGGWWSGAARG